MWHPIFSVIPYGTIVIKLTLANTIFGCTLKLLKWLLVTIKCTNYTPQHFSATPLVTLAKSPLIYEMIKHGAWQLFFLCLVGSWLTITVLIAPLQCDWDNYPATRRCGQLIFLSLTQKKQTQIQMTKKDFAKKENWPVQWYHKNNETAMKSHNPVWLSLNRLCTTLCQLLPTPYRWCRARNHKCDLNILLTNVSCA